jgi:hypothetical protein
MKVSAMKDMVANACLPPKATFRIYLVQSEDTEFNVNPPNNIRELSTSECHGE